MMYSLKGSLIDSGSGKALTAVVTDEEFGRKRGGIGDGFDAGETGDGLHDRAITGVAFDDQYIVAGGMDGIIRIWEANLQV